MATRWYRMGGGLNRKASTDAKPDDSLTVAYGCSFDEVGAVQSARGRDQMNNDTVVGNGIGGSGSVLGGFDGSISGTQYRFAKRGSEVFYGDVAVGGDLTSVLDTAMGTLAKEWPGASQPAFGSATTVTGFAYNGRTYFADGSARGRLNGSTKETWGLQAPGYREFTGANADPISTTSGDQTVTVTYSSGHGIRDGLLNLVSYPFDIPVEFVGLDKVGGVNQNDINCVHDGYDSSAGGDILVTASAVGGLDAATQVFTITYQNNAGAMSWAPLDVDPPTTGSNVNQTLSSGTTTNGDSSTGTNEVQTLYYGGTPATSGYFSLVVSNGSGGGQQRTIDLPYNATTAQVQAAFEGLDYFSSSTGTATTIATVTSSTQITFEAPSSVAPATGTGGGSSGFMRVGPKLAAYATSEDVKFSPGRYRYAYTFYNGVAESNFSAITSIDVTGTDSDSVYVSSILTGPAGTTERRLYRSDVNGTQLYLIYKIVGNGSIGEYYDIGGRPIGSDPDSIAGDAVTDASTPSGASDVLGKASRASRRSILTSETTVRAAGDKKSEKLVTNMGVLADWTDHDPPPASLKHVGVVGATCFGIDGSDLVFSKSGNIEHWPLSNRVTPGRNTSETLRTWLPFDREVIGYTDVALYRLTPLGLTYEDSRFEEIESPVGCAGEWAAAALDGLQGHIFLAKSGLYLFDGARVSEVSFPVEPLFTDPSDPDYIQPDYMSQAVMVTSRDRMFLSYRATNSAGNNDRILFADFQDMGNPKFMVWPLSVVSMWRERSTNNVIAGTSTGAIYKMDVGYTDNNSAIAWEVETKEYPLGGGAAVRLDEVLLDADFAGATTTVEVTTRVRGLDRTATFTSTATGRERIKFKLPLRMFGEVAKVNVSSSAASKRSLYAVGFTYAGADEP